MKKKKKVKKGKGRVAAKRKGAKQSGGTELPEVVVVLRKIDERLVLLERRTEMILSRISSRGWESKPAPRPEPQKHQPRRQLFQAVCADCSASCEVPFQPSENRAVYCKPCFAKRKNSQGGQLVGAASGPLQPAGRIAMTTAIGNRMVLAEKIARSDRARAAKRKPPKTKKRGGVREIIYRGGVVGGVRGGINSDRKSETPAGYSGLSNRGAGAPGGNVARASM